MLTVGGLGSFYMVPFFILHFGGFMLGHLVFIVFLTSTFPNQDFVYIRDFAVVFSGLKIGIISLFLSHGFSFLLNFIIKGEHRTTTIGALMTQPYGRVVMMHISIIIGGFLTMALGSSVGLLLMLVVLKTVIDAFVHLKERAKFNSNNLPPIKIFNVPAGNNLASRFIFTEALIVLCIFGFGIYTIFFRNPDFIPSMLNTKILLPVAKDVTNNMITSTPAPTSVSAQLVFSNWQEYNDAFNHFSISYPAQFELVEDLIYTNDGLTLLNKDVTFQLVNQPETFVNVRRSKGNCDFLQSLENLEFLTHATHTIDSVVLDRYEGEKTKYYPNHHVINVYAEVGEYCVETLALTPIDSGLIPVIKQIIDSIKYLN